MADPNPSPRPLRDYGEPVQSLELVPCRRQLHKPEHTYPLEPNHSLTRLRLFHSTRLALGIPLKVSIHPRSPTKVKKRIDCGNRRHTRHIPVKPLLSIAIPTKNRLSYVTSSIRTATRLADPDIEILIHDNSETNDLCHFVQELDDPRVHYQHFPKRLSMSENYEASLSMCNGRYISVIGDDDGVTRFLPLLARWADKLQLDLVVPTNTAHFVWPDLQLSRNGTLAPGELRFRQPTATVSQRDPQLELTACFQAAAQSFAGMPRAYYGIVSHRAYQTVHASSGRYFPGISPDMAAAVALSFVSPIVYHVDLPCFIPGSSARSNAGLSGLNRHVGELKDQPHLSTIELQQWNRAVPHFYSVQTIWAEAAIGAAMAMARPDLLKGFNFPRLYAELLTYHRPYKQAILHQYPKAIEIQDLNPIVGWLSLALSLYSLQALRAKCLLRNTFTRPRTNPSISVGNLSDILAASIALEQALPSMECDSLSLQASSL